MDYKIVVDSCGELTGKMKMSGVYTTASLSMQVDGDTIVDDASFDQEDFLKRVAASPECPKSSCPSPEEYMRLYEGPEKRVYAVTLSAELSGVLQQRGTRAKAFRRGACRGGEGDLRVQLQVGICRGDADRHEDPGLRGSRAWF